jgi:hypothetical protein
MPSFFLPEMVAFAKDGYAGLAIEHRGLLDLQPLDTTIDLLRGLDLTWYRRVDSGLQGMGAHGLGCVTFGSCAPALPAFADHVPG